MLINNKYILNNVLLYEYTVPIPISNEQKI